MLKKGYRILRQIKYIQHSYIRLKGIEQRFHRSAYNLRYKKLPQHRLRVLTKQLVKKGNFDAALKIVSNLIRTLWNEESKRRADVGGIHYISLGISKLEQSAEMKPIKKRKRIRFKRFTALSEQKSIAKATKILIDHCISIKKKTRQRFETVLKEELIQLFTGESQLFRLRKISNKEIFESRFRYTYEKEKALRAMIYEYKTIRNKQHRYAKARWFKVRYWYFRYRGIRNRHLYQTYIRLRYDPILQVKPDCVYIKRLKIIGIRRELREELKTTIKRQGWQNKYFTKKRKHRRRLRKRW